MILMISMVLITLMIFMILNAITENGNVLLIIAYALKLDLFVSMLLSQDNNILCFNALDYFDYVVNSIMIVNSSICFYIHLF